MTTLIIWRMIRMVRTRSGLNGQINNDVGHHKEFARLFARFICLYLLIVW